nr:probable ATP-dependent RNA helicase ddx42 [Leptinotarsa decemlineata]
MKRTWNNTNSSPGFIYFNQSPHSYPDQTSEFLPFSDSPASRSPSSFSNPRHINPRYSGGNSDSRSPNPKRHSGGNHRSPLYSNLNNRYSGGNFGTQNQYSNPNNRYSGGNRGSHSPHTNKNNRYSGGNRGSSSPHNSNNRYPGGSYGIRSPYSSPNNSQNFNNSFGRNRSNNKWNFGKNSSNDSKCNVSNYYDRTCTMDPWSELEEELKVKRAEEALQNSINCKDNSENLIGMEGETDSDSTDSSESDDSCSTVTEEETR